MTTLNFIKRESRTEKQIISFRGDWDVKKKIINCGSRQKTN